MMPSSIPLLLLSTLVAPDPGAPTLRLDPPAYEATPPMRLRVSLPEVEPQPRKVFVEVVDFDATVHASSRRDTWGLGVLRRGTVLAATRGRGRPGCSGWASLAGGGGVCAGDGVRISDELRTPSTVTLAPDVDEDLPYRYAKIAEAGTPRLARLPLSDELEQLQAGTVPSELPHVRTQGVVFVAIDRPYEVDGVSFVRTLEGDYLALDDVRPIVPPQTMGQPLIEVTLPIAFVHAGETPIVAQGDDGTLRPMGTAFRTARFDVTASRAVDDRDYVVSDAGWLVAREDVRLATPKRRPSSVEPGERWIHVDLDEQVLVAYEGDRAVFVTLVSTGKAGYETPRGQYRVRRKFVSRRMTGPDPDTGTYDIAEVPWAQYYHGGYALHGAYWHDEFGQVRSHGCTNLPPSAARWLFRWTAPNIPAGWHGRYRAGTVVVFG